MFGDRLVQAGVFRQLLRYKRQHRCVARSVEVGDDLLRIGLFQLVGCANLDEPDRACERHRVACGHNIGTKRDIAGKLIRIERKISQR